MKPDVLLDPAMKMRLVQAVEVRIKAEREERTAARMYVPHVLAALAEAGYGYDAHVEYRTLESDFRRTGRVVGAYVSTAINVGEPVLQVMRDDDAAKFEGVYLSSITAVATMSNRSLS